MRRLTLLVLLLLAVSSLTPLASTPIPAYEPYSRDEFPLWTYKVRRAETLFFGSLAITLPLASLAYNLSVSYLSAPAADSETGEFLAKLGIAASLSASISLADYIIGEVQAR